ncbi:hypothetical protein AAVH_14452 [Aphelenchoides avenae]|nr:hypothetical protein AAVH_14452 [Aphelenchus avenae]
MKLPGLQPGHAQRGLKDDEERSRKLARKLTNHVRTLKALYRLVYRQSSKLRLTDDEISVIVNFVHGAIDDTLIDAGAGEQPSWYREHAVEANMRLGRWLKQQGREEL